MWDKYKQIIPYISVGSGVVDTVAGWVKDQGRYSKVLVVCDPNTRSIAGARVIAALEESGVSVAELCFTENEPLPDERSIGCILSAFTPEIDIILGVGSGTINDLCTYVGSQVSRPSAIVGTAPSMDGYASLGSAMLFGGVKVTPMTQCPTAIFCDTDILSAAPMDMIAAGLGDMLGKITSLADWRLSHILTGEPMPGNVFDIMEGALNKIIASVSGAARRESAAIRNITEGLILSGIAMSLYGDSRPASGTEHHLAHFWEMRMLAEGRKPALHGTKVAVATVLGLEMWRRLAGDISLRLLSCHISLNDGSRAPHRLSAQSAAGSLREQDIRRLYGAAAGAIMQTENPNLSLGLISKYRQEILEIANMLPAPGDIAGVLSSVGINMRPKDINLDSDTLIDSVMYARERKKTYTLLQLLGDLDLLDDYAKLASEYFTRSALSGVKCFVLDMDGTIYLEGRLFPYTLSFLERLDELGIDYIFFTNNSSQNSLHYVDKLRGMGIEIPDDKLLMSTHVLLEYLEGIYEPWIAAPSATARNDAEAASAPADFVADTPTATARNDAEAACTTSVFLAGATPAADPGNKKRACAPAVFVAGTQALKDDFACAGYVLTEEDPVFCVLGFDTDMDYGRLAKLCDFIRAGLPVYGVNMDFNCPVDGGFVPDCGSLASAVHASTGVMPEFFGKPSRYALDYIVSKTGYREDELCFIGDRLYTDVAITDGTAARSVLVLSGETKRGDLAGSKHIPDVIAEDLRELQDIINICIYTRVR